jgi:type 1 glutamine amidotransferase
VFDVPEAEKLMTNGMLWAAAGKEYAVTHGLTTAQFESNLKMY